MRDRLEIDYQTLAVEVGDTFILATDGVYEFAEEKFVVETMKQHQDDLDQAARLIVDEALERGSKDNLTIQIVRIEQLPQHDIEELHQQASALPFPPELRPRMISTAIRLCVKCTAAIEARLPGDRFGLTKAGHHQGSFYRSAGGCSLPGSFPDGGVGRKAHRQCSRTETL